MNQNSREKYKQLFSIEEKARAFDRIAENYYYGNFGSMQKADLDVLLFSIYINQLMDKSENYQGYSNYTVSKLLGITQSRVNSLKEKEELKYPSYKRDWKELFKSVCDNARFEDGKIKIFIPERSVFLEVKHAIELNGGYIETQLNSALLQVRPEYFIDVCTVVFSDDKDTIEKNVKKSLAEHNIPFNPDDGLSFGERLKEEAPGIVADIIGDAVPYVGVVIKRIIKSRLQ